MQVTSVVKNINRRNLGNNTQRAGLTLLAANGEWVSAKALRLPSAGSRVRDLRKNEYGSFRVECRVVRTKSRSARMTTQTFYRITPTSVTRAGLARLFKGVVTA